MPSYPREIQELAVELGNKAANLKFLQVSLKNFHGPMRVEIPDISPLSHQVVQAEALPSNKLRGFLNAKQPLLLRFFGARSVAPIMPIWLP
jgi:hypothetical protein